MKTIKTLSIISLLALSISITSCKEDEPTPPKEPTIDEYGIVVDQEVDLGLPSGRIWAGWNIGATAPEEFGNHYACAEVETKEDYSLNTYSLWVDENGDGYWNRYYDHSEYTYIGTDFSGTKYDVANLLWGKKWRMPSYEDFLELIEECTWTFMLYKDVEGYKVTGPNGLSIFIPMAGIFNGTNFWSNTGHYWSSTIMNNFPHIGYGLALAFNRDYVNVSAVQYREKGYTIRAVK